MPRMNILKVFLAGVLGFVLGAAMFRVPTVRAQARSGAMVYEVPGTPSTMGSAVTGTPVALSCVVQPGEDNATCYVLTAR
jgi:hypothetical protein